jgi:acetyltransferase (GNAT) family protein
VVRPAVEEDAYLIAVLNSTMLSHTLSTGREYNLSELTFQAMATTMAQVTRKDSQNAGLVLTLDGKMVGHLLLELGDRMGYIYDLALEREQWGGTAVRHLMRSGSRLLFERNIPLFVGDVSASNRRALVVAQRALGFTVDCKRYGLNL